MQVSDQDLRELVREAIQRHTSGALSEARSAESKGESKGGASISFGKFLALAPSEDGQCIIEPAVRCNHCGYCQSYGH